MSGLLAPDAGAFGGLRGIVKRRAKQAAERRAKREVRQATGVDVDHAAAIASDPAAAARARAEASIAAGTGVDVSGGATGLKAQALGAVQSQVTGMLPAALRPYAGLSRKQIHAQVKADVYGRMGLNRFSPPHSRRAAERQVSSRVKEIMTGLAQQKIAANPAIGRGAVGRALEAATAGGLPQSRAELRAKIQAEVYAEKGIRPGAGGIRQKMADRIVEQRLNQLFGN